MESKKTIERVKEQVVRGVAVQVFILAGIGFFLSFGSVLFGLFGMAGWMQILIGVLACFSFAEGFFKFCAGCKIFGLLIHFKIIKKEECSDCVFESDM